LSLARNIAIVGLSTLVSRVLGFVRDVAIAGLFGAGPRADAFVIAFQFNNLARRLLTEGALNSAFVPLYLRKRLDGGDEAGTRFAGQVIGTVTLVLIVLAVALAFAMPLLVGMLAPGFTDSPERFSLATEIARLMLPYLVLAGPIAVLMGVLNAHQHYFATATTTVLFNVVVLCAVALVVLMQAGDSDKAAWIVALSIAVAGLCQLGLVIAAVIAGKQHVPLHGLLNRADTRSFATLALPGLMASGIPQLTIIAGAMIVSAHPGAVSFLYYANRLIELPLGIVGIAVGTVMTPTLAHIARDEPEGWPAVRHGLEISLALALPAAIALVTLAGPIIHILFERGAFTASDSQATAALLAAMACGLPGHVLLKALSPLFFARQDTHTPMIAAATGLVVSIAVGFALVSSMGPLGVAIAIALSGWCAAATLGLFALRRKMLPSGLIDWTRLALILLAAIAMGIAVRLMAGEFGLYTTGTSGRWLMAGKLAAVILGGLVLYLGSLWLFRIVRPSDLRQLS